MNNKRKIILLLAGGTHLLDKNDKLLTIDKKEDIDNWLQQIPELNIMADIEPIFVCGEYDSVDAHVWGKINKTIESLAKKADAFVVVTKLGSLIDTSLALAFGLQHLETSIITTSSQIDTQDFYNKKIVISKLKAKNALGIRSNLINALQASEVALPGPAIMFGTRLVSATKAVWDSSEDVDNIASIDNSYWGKVDFGINIKNNLLKFKKNNIARGNIFASVLVMENIEGVDWYLDKNSLANYQAIIIKINNGQGINDEKKQQLLDWDMPVVLYNLVLDLPSNKVASLINCTWNTALIKTMWVLANHDDANFKKNINSEYIGEFNI